jgi:hypothetical protein
MMERHVHICASCGEEIYSGQSFIRMLSSIICLGCVCSAYDAIHHYEYLLKHFLSRFWASV